MNKNLNYIDTSGLSEFLQPQSQFYSSDSPVRHSPRDITESHEQNRFVRDTNKLVRLRKTKFITRKTFYML